MLRCNDHAQNTEERPFTPAFAAQPACPAASCSTACSPSRRPAHVSTAPASTQANNDAAEVDGDNGADAAQVDEELERVVEPVDGSHRNLHALLLMKKYEAPNHVVAGGVLADKPQAVQGGRHAAVRRLQRLRRDNARELLDLERM